MAATMKMAGWSIDVHREQIEVTSLSERPDPKWEFADAAGHEHRWDGSDLPTLTYVIDGTDVYDDGDGYLDEVPYGHYECPLCREHVTPGMTGPPPWREFTPGPMSVTLTSPEGTPHHLDGHQIEAFQQCRSEADIERFVATLAPR